MAAEIWRAQSLRKHCNTVQLEEIGVCTAYCSQAHVALGQEDPDCFFSSDHK